VHGVFFWAGVSQKALRPSSMQELPGTGQSEALTHGGRHVPSAQTRPVAQSLLSAHRAVVVTLDVVHAGEASAAANTTPATQAAARTLLDRSRLRSIV
jgi:hypothetical protein